MAFEQGPDAIVGPAKGFIGSHCAYQRIWRDDDDTRKLQTRINQVPVKAVPGPIDRNNLATPVKSGKMGLDHIDDRLGVARARANENRLEVFSGLEVL